MSKEEKIKRAYDFIKKNKAILTKIEKLKKQYAHNHECAKNLFKKAQVSDYEIPSDYRQYTYGWDAFDTW